MAMAVELAQWWLALQAMVIAVWPLTRGLFGRLGDAGWGLAKVCGLAVVGLIHWQACYWGLWSNDATGIWLALGVALALSLAWTRGALVPWQWLARNWRYALTVEAVFLAAFVGWAWLRSANPGLTHTEQPMDMMILVSIWASPGVPPQDAWLAGHGLSYYYFGHWLMAAAGRLAGLASAVSYNIGQCAWFGLVVTGCLSIGRNLGLAIGLGRIRAWASGILATLAACFSGNIKATALALGIMEQKPGWWFGATRVIEDQLPGGKPLPVIDEFPFFSFMLGDNHAHVLALPLALLIIGLALSAALAPLPKDQASPPRAVARTMSPLPGGFILVLILAALPLSANAWDCAGLWPLLVLGVFIGAFGTNAQRAIQAALAAVSLVAVAALVNFPYLASAESPLGGLLYNLLTPSSPLQLLMALGLPLAGAVALLAAAWPQLRPGWRLIGSGASLAFGIPLALLLGSSLGQGAWGVWWRQPLSLIIIALPLALGVATLLKCLDRQKPHQGWSFGVLLAVAGLALIMAPEVVFLRDGFGMRMNTAFKFHYQAWLLLALAGGLGAAARRGALSKAVSVLWIAIALAGLSYAVTAPGSMTIPSKHDIRTLDPMQYVKWTAPGLADAIRWVEANTEPGQVIIQAKGHPYRWSDNAISSFTGRPAPLGWEGHQWQWRGGNMGPRIKAIDAALAKVYQGMTSYDFLEGMAELGSDLVLVGPKERRVYRLVPQDNPLEQLALRVFHSGRYDIYRLGLAAEEPK